MAKTPKNKCCGSLLWNIWLWFWSIFTDSSDQLLPLEIYFSSNCGVFVFSNIKKRNCSMPCELTTSVDSVRPHNVEPPFSGTCSVLSMEASFAAEIFKTLRSKIENDSILDFSSSNSNWLKQLSCFNKTHYGNSSIKLETSNAS